MTTMSDKLSTWIVREIEQRGWSHRELARRAGVSQTAVSGTLSGDRKAGADFCIKVAQALGESPEKVLRLAGILPASTSEDDPTFTELTDLARTLTPKQRREVLHYIRFLLHRGSGEK
jgi:transcriptional regulator with XRE-family HTH domain